MLPTGVVIAPAFGTRPLSAVRFPGIFLGVDQRLLAGRPIIASDYPILREILRHEHNAVLVKPQAPDLLAAEIERVLNDPSLACRISQQALVDSKEYSWEKRASSIWEFIERIGASSPMEERA